MHFFSKHREYCCNIQSNFFRENKRPNLIIKPQRPEGNRFDCPSFIRVPARAYTRRTFFSTKFYPLSAIGNRRSRGRLARSDPPRKRNKSHRVGLKKKTEGHYSVNSRRGPAFSSPREEILHRTVFYPALARFFTTHLLKRIVITIIIMIMVIIIIIIPFPQSIHPIIASTDRDHCQSPAV